LRGTTVISFNPDTIWDFNHNYDTIVLEGWNFFPSDSQYVEDTIDYGAGYDAAKLHAESLLNADVSKSYVFVTDEVDGYLFVDWFKPDGEISVWWGVEAGIILKGLTSEFDFDSSGVTTGLFW
jgi:hypothetical protein